MCRRLVNLSSILLWIVLQERPFPSHLHHWLILKSVDPRWILRQRQTEEASGGIKSGGVFLAVSSSDSFSTLIWTSTDNIQLLLLKDRRKDEEETWTTRQKRVRQQSKKENVCPSIHSVSPLQPLYGPHLIHFSLFAASSVSAAPSSNWFKIQMFCFI